jgi:predicted DNA-binding transcriptional regulator YafY
MLTATLPNTFSSYEWIRSRGSDITVIEPPTLRNKLIQEAKSLLSQYNVDSD